MKKIATLALCLVMLMATAGIGSKPWLNASADAAPDLMLTGAVTLIARNNNKVSVTATDQEGVYRLRNTDAGPMYNEIRFYFSDIQLLTGYKYAYIDYKNPTGTAWSVQLEDNGIPASICTGFTSMQGNVGLSRIENVAGGLLPGEITHPSYYIAVDPGADIEVSFWFSNDPDLRTPKPDLLLTGEITKTAFDSPLTTATTSGDGVYNIKANGATGAIQIAFDDFSQISGYKYCFVDYKNLGNGKVYGVYMAGYTWAYTVFPAVQSGQCQITTVGAAPGQADPGLFPAVISNPKFSINCAGDVEVELSFWFTNDPNFESKPLRQITAPGFQEVYADQSSNSTSASDTAVPGVYKVTNGTNPAGLTAYLGFNPQLNVSGYKYLYMEYARSPGNISFRAQGEAGGAFTLFSDGLPIPAGDGFIKMNTVALADIVNNLRFYVLDNNNLNEFDYEMTVSFYLSNDPNLRENFTKNADLSDLTVNGVSVEGFDPETTAYNVAVPNTDPVVIGATAVYPLAVVAGTGEKALNNGTTFIVSVTSQDGSKTKEYTVNIICYSEPDLETPVTDRLFSSNSNFEWSSDAGANVVDFLDNTSKCKQTNAMSLTALSSTNAKNSGKTKLLTATGSDAFAIYEVRDFASCTLELFGTSDFSAQVKISVSSDGSNYKQLNVKKLSVSSLLGTYKKIVLQTSEQTAPDMRFVKIQIPQISGAGIGKVLIDEFQDVYNNASYIIEYARSSNLVPENGVYSVNNNNTGALYLYRDNLQCARFTVRYKGTAPKIEMAVSTEGNQYNAVPWYATEPRLTDGYYETVIFANASFAPPTAFVKLSVQKSGGTSELMITGASVSALKLTDDMFNYNFIYQRTPTINLVSNGGVSSTNGDIIYNKNDIAGFDITLQYRTAGSITVFSSKNGNDWSLVSSAELDKLTQNSTTISHLRNTSSMPPDTDYLKIHIESSGTNSTTVQRVYIDGVNDYVAETRKICEKKGVSFKDIFSVNHTNGQYFFTEEDYLNEGINALAEMGCKTVNLWFTSNPGNQYPWNSDWPLYKTDTLTDLAKTPYFDKAFSNPAITTYLLYVESAESAHFSFMTPDQADYNRAMADEYSDVYAMCDYLLKQYNGSGKTFVVQTWESDGWVLGSDGKTDTLLLERYRQYIMNRQAAVAAARAANPGSDVKVYNCMEISNTLTNGEASLFENVIPNTACDMYALSMWFATWLNPARVDEAVKLYKQKTPASPILGNKNVYIGETGSPEMEDKEWSFYSNVSNYKTYINNDMRYITYWELFCNEPTGTYSPSTMQDNTSYRGFWLIRADGTKTPMYNHFKMLLKW